MSRVPGTQTGAKRRRIASQSKNRTSKPTSNFIGNRPDNYDPSDGLSSLYSARYDV